MNVRPASPSRARVFEELVQVREFRTAQSTGPGNRILFDAGDDESSLGGTASGSAVPSSLVDGRRAGPHRGRGRGGPGSAPSYGGSNGACPMSRASGLDYGVEVGTQGLRADVVQWREPRRSAAAKSRTRRVLVSQAFRVGSWPHSRTSRLEVSAVPVSVRSRQFIPTGRTAVGGTVEQETSISPARWTP